MGVILIPLCTCAIYLCHLCYLCKKTHRNGHPTQMTPCFLCICALFYTDNTVSHTDISLNPHSLLKNTQKTQIHSCCYVMQRANYE